MAQPTGPRPGDPDIPGPGSPLSRVIGQRTAAKLEEKLGLATAGDLLRHYPRRYNERGKLTDLAQLKVGDKATVWVRVAQISGHPLQSRAGDPRGTPRRGGRGGGPRHLTSLVVTDGKRQVSCSLFNQKWMEQRLQAGMEVLVSGKVGLFNGKLQLSSPSIATDRALGGPEGMLDFLESFAGGLIPVYPLAEGVTNQLVSQSVKIALDVVPDWDDPVPPELLAGHGLTDLASALRDVHRPRSAAQLDQALRRLRYDEALSVQLVLARRHARARQSPAEPCPRVAGGLLDTFDARLPFTLTAGQREVGEAIASDLSTIHPMNRLLQGEVGSGKTVVALRAMLQVVDNGRQAALLAPTEVLAGQHYRSLRTVLGPLGAAGELGAAPDATAVRLLTGSSSASSRRTALLDIAAGGPGIFVGTHALLSDAVAFSNLGLVVVDEQHRFGVEQRNALRAGDGDSGPPHLLVMTATPIPRTVAMTVFGDLDVSTLAELPHGRAGVDTVVVPAAERPAWLDRAWTRVREEVGKGRQAYVVCPKIGEPGEKADDGIEVDTDERRPLRAVLAVAEELRAGPLAGLRLAVLHGRMPPADKDATMRGFAAGEIDVMVATTVIEVGVDVPNATAMVILDAERFGMSQLHQLRGRVGRGSLPGVCLLVTDSNPDSDGRARLDAVAHTSDGFALAEADLELRREGDVLGTVQAGRNTTLRQLSLLRDRAVIESARTDAQSLVGDDPELSAFPGLAALADELVAEENQEYLQKG